MGVFDNVGDIAGWEYWVYSIAFDVAFESWGQPAKSEGNADSVKPLQWMSDTFCSP